jgi:class 3 adenylate cyclase
MACSGLLHKADNPVLNCVQCGLKMIRATQSLGPGWDLRVGVSVGQVVAGVIGRRQYLFDLWGDTVNMGARMESHGEKGRITLTAEAWQWMAGLATAEEAVVEVKGKGPLTVFRLRDVSGQLSALSSQLSPGAQRLTAES